MPLAACTKSGTAETATLHILGGTVEVTAGSGDFDAATEGQVLEVGDTIRTGADGRAEILWFEGSRTRLDHGTTLTVERLRSNGDVTLVEASQATGNTYHVVRELLSPDSRFDIETPNAAAGVQGTEYAVFVDADGGTIVAVIDRSVLISALGGEVAVDAGLSFSVPAAADEFSTLGPPLPIPDELLEGEWLTFNARGQRVFVEGIPLAFGLLFDPDNTVAYVASEALAPQGGGVYRVDGAGNAEQIVALNGASALAFDSAGTLYVTDDDNLLHAIVDGEATLAADFNGLGFTNGLNPNAIAIDADDNLYVSFNSAGVIIRFDPDHALPGVVVADGLDQAQGLAFDPASGVVYFMDLVGTIYWIDPATGDAGVLVAFGFEETQGGLAFGPDGALYAAGYLDGTIRRIDIVTGESSVCLSGILTPRGIAFDALDRIYVTSYDAGEVLRFDACEG